MASDSRFNRIGVLKTSVVIGAEGEGYATGSYKRRQDGKRMDFKYVSVWDTSVHVSRCFISWRVRVSCLCHECGEKEGTEEISEEADENAAAVPFLNVLLQSQRRLNDIKARKSLSQQLRG